MSRRRRPSPKVCAARGVSLIEVIVALVVLSSFGAALFTWAGQNLQAARRAAEAQREVEIERNVNEVAAGLNPALQPEGRIDTAVGRMAWRSEVHTEPSDVLRYPTGTVSAYAVGLYRVRFSFTAADGRAPAWTGERLVAGVRQVRPRPSGPPGFN